MYLLLGHSEKLANAWGTTMPENSNKDVSVDNSHFCGL